MEFSDDTETLKEWIPVMMENRDVNEPVAATKIDSGTDVNCGVLTAKLLEHLQQKDVEGNYKHTVHDLKRTEDGAWEVKVQNDRDGAIEYHTAKHVFIGAGGGALSLLQKTNIPDSKHIGGFPVS